MSRTTGLRGPLHHSSEVFFLFGPADATDQLEQKVIEFFTNAKKNKPEWREEQMEVIKKV